MTAPETAHQSAHPAALWNTTTIGLLLSSTLAGFGAWIDFLVILTLAAFHYQADGFVMALVSALFLLPGLLLGPRLGRWLDRLVDGNSPGAAIAVALGLRALATGLMLLQPSLWVFCLLVALRSVFTLPVDPAFNVVVSRVVAHADVPRYFGVLGLLRNVSKIAAPVIGTSMASVLGDGFALGTSIVLTLAAGVLALGVAWEGAPPTQGAVGGAAANTSAHTHIAPLDHALLHQFLATVTVFAFMVFFVNHPLPVLLRNAGFDKALLGVLVSCSGAGGILAALVMTRRSAAVAAMDPMTATTLSVLATALCFVVLGLAFLLPLHLAPYAAGAVFFCTGVSASIEAIRSNTVLVQHFAGRTGEVSGQLQAYSSAAMLAAPWAAALVMPFVPLPLLLWLDGSVAFALVAAIALKFRVKAGTQTQTRPSS